MASLYKVGTTYRILFSDGNGKRKSIWLGKMPKKAAETVLSNVEAIISYRLANRSLPTEVSSWLGGLSDDMLKKLAKAGLATYERHTADELWTQFRKWKNGDDVEKTTLNVYDHAERRFFAFFDRNTDLRNLQSEHFETWKTFLMTEYRNPRTGKPLAVATVAGTVTKVKAVFNWAKRQKWIDSSPLEGVGCGSFVNEAKDREVNMDMYYLLLDACPCSDWRAIIALARIGGLRPCEILRLRWADVDWERSRFKFLATKTKRYKGKGVRVVPLFPALRVELVRHFEDESSKGKEYVVNRYTNRESVSLAMPFNRIARKAGLEPVPRPFDNMRSSRATEVADEFGEYLESVWIGHTAKTAKECYIRLRDVDFERAAGVSFKGQPEMRQASEMAQSSAPNGKSENWMAQNLAQQASESVRTELRGHEKKPTFVGSVESLQVGATTQTAESDGNSFRYGRYTKWI